MPLFATANLRKKTQIRYGLAVLACITMTFVPCHLLAASDPWLLTFPEITSDRNHAYFIGADWVGYYPAGFDAIYTVPRDSVELPSVPQSVDFVSLDKFVFIARGSDLIRAKGQDSTTFSLPDPSADALEHLATEAKQQGVATDSPQEIIHPLAARDNKVWFGLRISDDSGRAHIGGIGWFDTKAKRFGRIYAPALAGFAPQWIGIAADTVNVLLTSESSGTFRSKLLRYSIASGTLSEVDLRSFGIEGESIRSAAIWADTLLFSTGETIAIWKPGKRLMRWSTRMYATREAIPLYAGKFNPDSQQLQDTVLFQVLRPTIPSAVKAQVGDWMEIVAPDAIEGYVDDAAWRQHQTIWAERIWDCGDSLCFARIRIPQSGSFIEGDFIHIPLTYIGKDDFGIKIGFRGAWARKQDLLPVLMPR